MIYKWVAIKKLCFEISGNNRSYQVAVLFPQWQESMIYLPVTRLYSRKEPKTGQQTLKLPECLSVLLGACASTAFKIRYSQER